MIIRHTSPKPYKHTCIDRRALCPVLLTRQALETEGIYFEKSLACRFSQERCSFPLYTPPWYDGWPGKLQTCYVRVSSKQSWKLTVIRTNIRHTCTVSHDFSISRKPGQDRYSCAQAQHIHWLKQDSRIPSKNRALLPQFLVTTRAT